MAPRPGAQDVAWGRVTSSGGAHAGYSPLRWYGDVCEAAGVCVTGQPAV